MNLTGSNTVRSHHSKYDTPNSTYLSALYQVLTSRGEAERWWLLPSTSTISSAQGKDNRIIRVNSSKLISEISTVWIEFPTSGNLSLIALHLFCNKTSDDSISDIACV